jgi:uncharacterized damage-inducible protein DinB
MLPLLADYVDRLSSIHEEMDGVLDGLPIEAMDWAPGPEMNSLAVLVSHIAGAQRYWVGEVAAGDPVGSERGAEREAEFAASGLDAGALRERLAEALAHSRSALQRVTEEDVERIRELRPGGPTYTVLWPLAHALQHTATHLGHMQLTRQLWEQPQRPAVGTVHPS